MSSSSHTQTHTQWDLHPPVPYSLGRRREKGAAAPKTTPTPVQDYRKDWELGFKLWDSHQPWLGNPKSLGLLCPHLCRSLPHRLHPYYSKGPGILSSKGSQGALGWWEKEARLNARKRAPPQPRAGSPFSRLRAARTRP